LFFGGIINGIFITGLPALICRHTGDFFEIGIFNCNTRERERERERESRPKFPASHSLTTAPVSFHGRVGNDVAPEE